MTTRYIDQFRTNLSTEEVLALALGHAKPMWGEAAYTWQAYDEDGILTTTYVDEDEWKATCKESSKPRRFKQFSCPVHPWQAMTEAV